MASPDEKVQERTRTKQKEPELYKVVLLNDDYTTMEFVVQVLEHVFEKSPAEAYQIIIHVHTQGRGIAGVYPWEVAETEDRDGHEPCPRSRVSAAGGDGTGLTTYKFQVYRSRSQVKGKSEVLPELP